MKDDVGKARAMTDHDTPRQESPDTQRRRIESMARDPEMQQVAATARPRGPERSPQPGTHSKQKMQRRLATMAEVAARDPKVEQRIKEREQARDNRVAAKQSRSEHPDAEADGQRVSPVSAQWDERQHPTLPGTLTDRNGGTRQLVTVTGDMRQLSLGFYDANHTEPDQLPLPGIEPVQPSPVPVLPFVAPFDHAGGTSMTQGRGAAHSLRLFVETLLAVPPELRRSTGTPTAMTCTLRQLRDALWPRGWQRGRDWPRLMAGLDDLSRLGVEWELPNGQGGVWYTVTVRSRPRDGALLDDVFRFEVLLPPGSHHGPMIDRTHLRLLGLDSAPAFRLYLALCWLWDTHGTYRGRLIGPTVRKVERDDAGLIRDVRGRRVTEHNGTPSRRATHKRAVPTGGRIVNPAALEQYPALSPDDLAAMAYAPADLAIAGTRRRDQRRYARKALNLVKEVVGCSVIPAKRPDGMAACIRVLPPETHKAAHDTAFERRRYTRRPT